MQAHQFYYWQFMFIPKLTYVAEHKIKLSIFTIQLDILTDAYITF